MQAWLEASNGDKTELRGMCVVGRSSKGNVVLSDPHISRRHALIQQQSEHEFWLVDLGSANGTRLNGRRLVQPCALKNGDAICFHNFEFVYRAKSPAPALSDQTEVTEMTYGATIVAAKQGVFWLLLADIENSSHLSKTLQPEELAQIVGSWLLQCRDAIEKVGGTVNKYLGDGIFAYVHDEPGAAARVSELVAALGRLQEKRQPPFRLVLHFGMVTLGGAGFSGEENLMGQEVNFLFRLEKVAGKLGTHVALSAPAAKRWADRERIVSLGEQSVPSFDGRHEVFAVKA